MIDKNCHYNEPPLVEVALRRVVQVRQYRSSHTNKASDPPAPCFIKISQTSLLTFLVSPAFSQIANFLMLQIINEVRLTCQHTCLTVSQYCANLFLSDESARKAVDTFRFPREVLRSTAPPTSRTVFFRKRIRKHGDLHESA